MNTIQNCIYTLSIYLWLIYIDVAESCNTLDDPFDRICVYNKTEDVNLSFLNMITRINESKA